MRWPFVVFAIPAGAVLLLLKNEWRYWGHHLSLMIVRLASLLQGELRWRYREEWGAELAAVREEYDVPGFTWACATLIGSVRSQTYRIAHRTLEASIVHFRRNFAEVAYPADKPIRMVRFCRAIKGPSEEWVAYGRGDSAAEVLTKVGARHMWVMTDEVSKGDDQIALNFERFIRFRGKLNPVRGSEDQQEDRDPFRRSPWWQFALWLPLMILIAVAATLYFALTLPRRALHAYRTTKWWLSDDPDAPAWEKNPPQAPRSLTARIFWFSHDRRISHEEARHPKSR
jgi:hypothetical protein